MTESNLRPVSEHDGMSRLERIQAAGISLARIGGEQAFLAHQGAGEPDVMSSLVETLDNVADELQHLGWLALDKPVRDEVIRSPAEFDRERQTHVTDFRKVPAIVVGGHLIRLEDFTYRVPFYAALSTLPPTHMIELDVAYRFFGSDDLNTNKIYWRDLRKALAEGTSNDAVMAQYLKVVRDPGDRRKLLVYLEEPEELPDDPRVTRADRGVPEGLYMTEDEDFDRQFYLKEHIEIDGESIPTDGIYSLSDIYFMAKWTHLTSQSPVDTFRIVTSPQLFEIAAPLRGPDGSTVDTENYVADKCSKLRRGTPARHGLHVFSEFYSEAYIRNNAGVGRARLSLLASPEKQAKYWEAFYQSERMNKRLGWLIPPPEWSIHD